MAEILVPIVFFLSVFGSIVALKAMKYFHLERMKELEGDGGSGKERCGEQRTQGTSRGHLARGHLKGSLSIGG